MTQSLPADLDRLVSALPPADRLGAIRAMALALSPADRRALMEALSDAASNDAEEPSDPAWSQAWSRELDRRSAEMDSGAVVGIPWDEVRDSALARLASK